MDYSWSLVSGLLLDRNHQGSPDTVVSTHMRQLEKKRGNQKQ
jgi:hypothetical protein